ncbi:MAG: type II secretion system F family protein [Candidatus Levybacteria bacterium]|nr:type II secretion system F family protein [Candidatus Levybacteria bacterium]
MKLERISLSSSEKLGLLSNISTMLEAGIPILEVIDSLLEDSKGNQQKFLQTLREDLIQGKRLYLSFGKFPAVFDKVTVNIIRASEEAGTLDITLKDLKKNIQRDIEFIDKVKAALIYPIMIVIVFVGVLLMILIFVVPKISSVFSRLNVDLPLPTKIMIALSNTLIAYAIPVVVVTIAAIIGFIILYKHNKKFMLGALSSLPLIQKLVKNIDLTRFTRSLYLLLNAGLPITSALELTEDVVLKKEVYAAIKHTKETVLGGAKLSKGFKDKREIFPSIVIKIAEAGERSGSLEKSMQDASEYLDYEVTNTLKTITTLLEPLLLVVAGSLIGGMMLTIVSPIYNLIGQVGGR